MVNVYINADSYVCPLVSGRILIESFGAETKKGYLVPSGYMGYIDGKYRLFASESDYNDYTEEE